jgi:FtsH ternary system domain X3-analog
MAEMLIILRRDPQTGKQNIVVKLDSDPDALPIEHEQLHKRLVEKLVGKGLDPEDLGEIIVEREEQTEPTAPVSRPNEPQRQKQGQGQ